MKENTKEVDFENMSDAEAAEYAKNVKFDKGRVTEMFESLIEQEADRKNLAVEKVAFCLFLMKKSGIGRSWRTRCRILSLSNPPAFSPEVVKIKEITEMDMLGHLSKAIRLIIEEEKAMLDHAKNVNSEIGLFECYIQVTDKKLDLTMVYDKKPIRKFDLEKEFGQL